MEAPLSHPLKPATCPGPASSGQQDPGHLQASRPQGTLWQGADLQVTRVGWQSVLLCSRAAGSLQQVHVITTTNTSSTALLPLPWKCPFQKLHSGRQLGAIPPRVLRFLNIQAGVSRIPEALLKSTLCPILALESQGSRLGNQEKLHQSLDDFCAHRSSGTRDLQQEIVMVTHTLFSLGWEREVEPVTHESINITQQEQL